MLRVLSVLFLAFLLSFPASSKSNSPPLSLVNSQTEQLQQQVRQLQTDLEAAKNDREDHDKLIEQSKSMEDFEKRIEDLGLYIALFGILITVIVIFFALRTSRESIAEAKQAAEKEVNIWLAEAIKPLQETLKEQGAKILADIHQQGRDTIEKIETDVKQQIKALLDRLDSSQGNKGKVRDPNDVAELRRITEQLRQNPEYQYSFDDWRALYLEAADRKSLDEVNKYVEGMERTATGDWQNAIAKTGRGWLLVNLEQYAEAINVWDQIVDWCGAIDDPHLIERVVNALVNKGLTLLEQGLLESAITVYDEVVSRYDQLGDASIAKLVAKALYCRADALRKLKRMPEAKVAYTMIIERYASCTESEILAYVEIAKKVINKLSDD